MRRGRNLVAALSVTEVVSWGVVYYAVAVFLLPMQRELGWTATEATGAYSAALLVSAACGVAVGRHLDRRGPRALMTAGSAAGALLVLAWSQVQGLAAYYALWLGLGAVMATTLYEPVFVVFAKRFADAEERRRAMTTITLAGALSSFLFLPLAQALIDALGWRDALVVLAVLLAVVTIPTHALALDGGPAVQAQEHGDSAQAGEVLRTPRFWLLAAAFFLATVAAVAVIVQGIPVLLERGYGEGFAAFAIGLIGVAQIPGRLLFGRLPARRRTVAVIALSAAGILLVAAVDTTATVLAGMVLLGMGNGMATLARATVIADRYGPAAYGAIGSVAGGATMVGRAVAPVTAAAFAGVAGYAALLFAVGGVAMVAAGLAYAADA